MFSSLRRGVLLLATVAVAVLLAGCTTGHTVNGSGSPAAPTGGGQSPAHGRPNIVFVLTDDLATNLVPYMPHVQQMQRSGVTFPSFFVVDSLCCPSRSSILTGEYPHDTGVFTNGGGDGGFDVFKQRGNESRSFGIPMRAAGYRTGFMGKYLNGYQPADPLGTSTPYVPPGWDEWDVTGNGYPELNYNLNENGKVVHYGHNPSDYLTDVLGGKAKSFIDASAAASKPFMLEVATFAPHKPATPAPRDAHLFPNLTAPRTAAYDKDPAHAPPWLTKIPPLTAKDNSTIDRQFAKRVRSVQAVDDMLGHLEQAVQAKGLAGNTYFVFSSDNGYHMGEYQLRPGKQTAFDTDINVPLVVTGPGVPTGKRVPQLTTSIDLAPTFETLGGVTPADTVDGHSLVPLLHGQPVSGWQQAVLIEHHGPDTTKGDPDKAGPYHGDPPSYEAIRTADTTYVEYADGEREYYDLARDPSELDNAATTAPPAKLTTMRATLAALRSCRGSASCWSAGQLRK